MLTRRMLPDSVSPFPVPVLPRGRRGAATARRPGWQAGALLAAAALLAGCSFDYSESGASAEELLETVPETELHEVTHSVVRGGRLVAEISAEQVQNFPRQRYALLEEVRYVEYDAAGEPVTTGSAERAVFYSEREDARVAGAIRLRSESQGVSMEARSLRWEGLRHRLVSDEEVAISRDDGSEVRAGGVDVDMRRKRIRFTAPVSGTLVTDDEEEEGE